MKYPDKSAPPTHPARALEQQLVLQVGAFVEARPREHVREALDPHHHLGQGGEIRIRRSVQQVQQHELLVLVGGTARAEYSIHREAPVECGEPASGINRSARTRLCWAGVGLRRVPAAAQRHPLCVLLHVTLQSDQDSGGVRLHHPRREPRSLRTLREHEAAQV